MIDSDLLFLIAEIFDFSELIPLLAFLLYARKRIYPMLFWQLLLAAVINISSMFLSSAGIYNLYLYHLLGLTEIVLIPLFYKSMIRSKHKFDFFFYLNIFIYLLISLYEGIDTINALSRAFSSFVCLTHGIVFLFQLYKNESIQDLASSGLFIINAAFLIYFSSSFFTFLLSREILSLEFSLSFSAGWFIHIIANFIKNIIIAVALRFRPYG